MTVTSIEKTVRIIETMDSDNSPTPINSNLVCKPEVHPTPPFLSKEKVRTQASKFSSLLLQTFKMRAANLQTLQRTLTHTFKFTALYLAITSPLAAYEYSLNTLKSHDNITHEASVSRETLTLDFHAMTNSNVKSDRLFHVKQSLSKGHYELMIRRSYNEDTTEKMDEGEYCYLESEDSKRLKFNRPNPLSMCNTETVIPLRIMKEDTYEFLLDTSNETLTVSRVIPVQNDVVKQTCPAIKEPTVTIDVSHVFENGSWIKEAFSGDKHPVINGAVRLAANTNSEGVLLLKSTTPPNQTLDIEPSEVSKETVDNAFSNFHWDNAIVYFVMTDRFYNGNLSNDFNYGRTKDDSDNIGTFHGGDIAGLTEKLNYIAELGVNAIWMTSPLEQIHGWVGGGDNGDFKHYGYHGYYHLDWTNLDANMGTEKELREFVTRAHQLGIKVIWDVVLNHVGYATLADMQEFDFGSLIISAEQAEKSLGAKWTDWTPTPPQSWHSFNDYLNFTDGDAWEKWWGHDWIRTDIGNYPSPGYDALTMSLNFLPDVITESNTPAPLPHFFKNKPNHQADDVQRSPSENIIMWLSEWVREYGIDGFRVDTAKHVEKETFQQLKTTANTARQNWLQVNGIEDGKEGQQFWMTGEAWGHGAYKSDYFDAGFDSMINFEFQNDVAPLAIECLANIDSDYQRYAETINKDSDFNVLSYLSSHDTKLFFGTEAKSISEQKRAANALMLSPGAVQIYYGDETARPFGATGSDPLQGTRSPMNWGDNPDLLKHWQTLGNFRNHHPALSKGIHQRLSTEPYYAFSRTTSEDKVMVVYIGNQTNE